MAKDKHVALLIEMPVIYTDDLDDLREYRDEFESESDWLLNCLRIGGRPVRVRFEIDGEKNSEVVEVWGLVREAQAVEPSPGYQAGPITDDQLAENGFSLMRDEHACEWCMTDPDALSDE